MIQDVSISSGTTDVTVYTGAMYRVYIENSGNACDLDLTDTSGTVTSIALADGDVLDLDKSDLAGVRSIGFDRTLATAVKCWVTPREI